MSSRNTHPESVVSCDGEIHKGLLQKLPRVALHVAGDHLLQSTAAMGMASGVERPAPISEAQDSASGGQAGQGFADLRSTRSGDRTSKKGQGLECCRNQASL